MTSAAERYAAFRARQKEEATELSVFRRQLDFELDDFQVRGCRAVEDGHAVLVAAPTGAGKTVVGEFAVHLALAGDYKAFYTTPIKALSNQKYLDLVAAHGKHNVGLLTGDTSINGEAPVVVMTTEVLRNMIYADSPTLERLRYVVMDEVHYLADRFRGPVWEEIIIHLAENVQLVALSATVSNAEEFGDWLSEVRGGTDVVVSERRPVPLWQHMMVGTRLHPLYAARAEAVGGEAGRGGHDLALNPELLEAIRQTQRTGRNTRRGGRSGGAKQRHERRSRDRREGRGQRPQLAPRVRPAPRPMVIERLDRENLLPAIVFVFSRAGCEAAVAQAVRTGVRLTTAEEGARIRQVVEEAVSGVPHEDLAVLGYDMWARALEYGVAAHHAGLLPVFKETVEQLFTAGLVKVVYATETLALGINMPARSVVLEQLVKWNGSGHVQLTPGEYTQLTGRAGRRGIDVEGHAVVLYSDEIDPAVVAGLASRRTYPLRSAFHPTYNMAVNLLDSMGRMQAREVLETSFAQFQADRGVVGPARQARKLSEAIAGYAQAMRESGGKTRERWERRWEKAVDEHERLLARIERSTGTIAQDFDRICTVLETLGYVTPAGDDLTVTDAGRQLSRIYAEKDLLLAECLREGIWDQLQAPQLAALVSSVVYEARNPEPRGPGPLPGGKHGILAQGLRATTRLAAELADLERASGVPERAAVDPGLVAAVHQWAGGAPLAEVLQTAELGAGDFVRWCKQILDVLDQLARAAEGGPLAARAEEATGLVRRGVVAWSSV